MGCRRRFSCSWFHALPLMCKASWSASPCNYLRYIIFQFGICCPVPMIFFPPLCIQLSFLPAKCSNETEDMLKYSSTHEEIEMIIFPAIRVGLQSKRSSQGMGYYSEMEIEVFFPNWIEPHPVQVYIFHKYFVMHVIMLLFKNYSIDFGGKKN